MARENDESFREDIVRRLDIIIHLLLDPQKQEGKSNRDIISELVARGLRDKEIAVILGRSRSYIASELTLLRKQK